MEQYSFPYESHKKQRLFTHTVLTDQFVHLIELVRSVRWKMSLYV